jgi:Fur family ferric uptake transcriptional regulator
LTSIGRILTLAFHHSPSSVSAAEASLSSSHPDSDAAVSDLLHRFREFLGQERLRSTRQREIIVEALARSTGHVSVEELHHAVRAVDSSIGYATVYRTLKILVDARLAAIRHFGDGQARFEPRQGPHHDHMICETCGHIFEFHDEQIEQIQEKLVRDRGFELSSHRHELRVKCLDPNCPRRPDA